MALCCNATVSSLMLEIRNSVLAPSNAAANVSGFARSPVTQVMTGRFFAFFGLRTSARAAVPFCESNRTISPPTIPVPPVTKIINASLLASLPIDRTGRILLIGCHQIATSRSEVESAINSVATIGFECLLWVKSRHDTWKRRSPLYLQKRTFRRWCID